MEAVVPRAARVSVAQAVQIQLLRQLPPPAAAVEAALTHNHLATQVARAEELVGIACLLVPALRDRVLAAVPEGRIHLLITVAVVAALVKLATRMGRATAVME